MIVICLLLSETSLFTTCLPCWPPPPPSNAPIYPPWSSSRPPSLDYLQTNYLLKPTKRPSTFDIVAPVPRGKRNNCPPYYSLDYLCLLFARYHLKNKRKKIWTNSKPMIYPSLQWVLCRQPPNKARSPKPNLCPLCYMSHPIMFILT